MARWIECGLQTERWSVRFPVRAHAWVAGQVRPQLGACERQLRYIQSIDVSFPLLPPPFPSLQKYTNHTFKRNLEGYGTYHDHSIRYINVSHLKQI